MNIKGRIARLALWLCITGFLSSFVFFLALSDVRSARPVPELGRTSALNNHGDIFFVTKSEAWFASSAPLWALGAIVVGAWVAGFEPELQQSIGNASPGTADVLMVLVALGCTLGYFLIYR